MTVTLRGYQRGAIDAVMGYWATGGGNPLVDLATGTGKSVVIATLVREVIERWPGMRVLMLVHVKELVDQNARALLRTWPGAPVGINSAGLGRRDLHQQILFASVQSVFRRAERLGRRDLVLIDEAHLTPKAGNGMYGALLDQLRELVPDMRVGGFTATPYRLDSGRLDEGDDRLFDDIVYTYGIGEGIADGYLSPLVSKATAAAIDVSGVARRGGEFIAGDLERAVDQEHITRAAVDEIVARGQERRSWLAFCTGVAHARKVRDAMRARGVSCETVTGDTPSGERDRIVASFKAGQIRCLTNANVLTTGFDAPAVDLVAMLRPTLSTGLYVQIVGRGTRIAEGKADCLVLDFAGNVRRHGPVDAIEVRGRASSAGDRDEVAVKPDTVRAKECPDCASLLALSAASCVYCGHEFKVEGGPKHDAHADDTPILSTGASAAAGTWLDVRGVTFHRHEKFGSPTSLRVEYDCGLQVHREWVCFEHTGFARDKARRWWKTLRGDEPAPETIDEALTRKDELTLPQEILVRPSGKFMEVLGRRTLTGPSGNLVGLAASPGAAGDLFP